MSGVYKFSFFFLVENVYFRSLKYVNIFSSSKRKEEQQQQGESNWTNKSGINLNWTPLLPPPFDLSVPPSTHPYLWDISFESGKNVNSLKPFALE